MQANFVSAIILNAADEVLMIYVQGDDDPMPLWSLPGGRVEQGETAEGALMREVREETGLIVTQFDALCYQTLMQFDDRLTRAEVYITSSWTGTINPQDPEDEIIKAAWIPREQAITHLHALDYPPMSEPPAAYLAGIAGVGKLWQYRLDGTVGHWVNND